MTTWEYLTTTLWEAAEENLSEIELLDKLGSSGWELIAVSGHGEDRKYYFKRPRPAKKGRLHTF